MRYDKKARVVAFCGIDGAGKTSTLARLREDIRFQRAMFVGPKRGDNLQRLARLHSDRHKETSEHMNGDYASSIRWAYAFDFLRFYEDEVMPLLDTDVLILSDRWSYCISAYAWEGTAIRHEIEFLLSCVQPVDLIVYLDVEPEQAQHRMIGRGKSESDKAIELLSPYREAYKAMFAAISVPVFTVYNDNLDITVERVSQKLEIFL